MKARPRSVERRVAEELSKRFDALGLPPVKRIPVLGKVGPDLTWNAFELIVDVKSRLEISEKIYLGKPVLIGGLLGVPLDHLPISEIPVVCSPYKNITAWYGHMDEWTRSNVPSGISALVLHRPGMPVGKSLLVISTSNEKEFLSRWNEQLKRMCQVTTQLSLTPC